MLNIPMMKPEIVKYIGQFYLRYSYGQNLWEHSIEVARIAEAIAAEMNIDPVMAKKAGLLHDIGKVIGATGESHTQVGADSLRKLGVNDIIVNAAESHHYDVPMTHVISRIIAAADAISASRPGARFNTSELFIEKMNDLEKLISSVHGVSKVHIMQAGRDIMVYVDPHQIDDKKLTTTMKDIATKVEEQLDYPGIIRISAIREQKLVEFLK
jgi:ribonuclease Y